LVEPEIGRGFDVGLSSSLFHLNTKEADNATEILLELSLPVWELFAVIH
jgi:hypothetical protein